MTCLARSEEPYRHGMLCPQDAYCTYCDIRRGLISFVKEEEARDTGLDQTVDLLLVALEETRTKPHKRSSETLSKLDEGVQEYA